VSRRAAKGTPLFAGTASYAYAAVETLFYYEPPSVRLEGEFGTYEGPLLLAATGITNRYGGGFQIVPNARIDDGLFDVCVIRPVSALTVLRLLVTLFWGGHVSHPAVSIHQTRTLTIETETPLLLYADGEPMCETPVTIEIIKGGLVVMSPRKIS
jgi:diacylglycerol kinase (ATP)